MKGSEQRQHADRLNFLFPDWQSSAESNAPHKGALTVAETLRARMDFVELRVTPEEQLKSERGVLGYQAILKQLKGACSIIEASDPNEIFTVGGTCGAEVAPVSFLNQKYEGDLAVLWFDAHGDLNTPQSSPSEQFHGMSLRALLGEGDALLIGQAFSGIEPEQVVLVGARDLDPAEVSFIEQQEISVLSPDELQKEEVLVGLLQAKGFRRLYLHLDLDVLDPESFPHVVVPTPGGISLELLLRLLRQLRQAFPIVGFSVVEFVGSDPEALGKISKIVDTVLGDIG